MNRDIQGAREVFDYIRAADPDEGFGMFTEIIAVATDQAMGAQFLRDVQTLCSACARQETVHPGPYEHTWYHGGQLCMASGLHERLAIDLRAALEAHDASQEAPAH